ncbi:MAG: DUF1887 family CARF protein [Methylomonas sp.]|jgi:hypothetical protein
MSIPTQLILVSAQPAPNLTPILDESLRPRKVIMMVSDDMVNQARALEKIYKGRLGLQVEWVAIRNPWDAGSISAQIDKLIHPYPPDGIVLNATGGTKLMSIAAYEAFYTQSKPVFYVHPERDCIIWLNSELPPRDLENRLTIKDYLGAYGAAKVDYQTHGVPTKIKALTGVLIANIEKYHKALGVLNFLAMRARDTLQAKIDDKQREYPALHELISLFYEAGLCRVDADVLSFPDEDKRFMVNGGWLEQHCYSICRKLRNRLDIQDVACNIDLERPQGAQSVPNEIDLAVLAENRLFLLECKTKYFNEQSKKNSETAKALYQLNTLRTLYGGSQARAMLVSYRKLDASVLHRASDLKIEVCHYIGLKRLEHVLLTWLQSAIR